MSTSGIIPIVMLLPSVTVLEVKRHESLKKQSFFITFTFERKLSNSSNVIKHQNIIQNYLYSGSSFYSVMKFRNRSKIRARKRENINKVDQLILPYP